MSEYNKQERERIFPETEFDEDAKPKDFKDKLFLFYYNAIPFFNINLAWIVMSLPLVTIFPALGGLYYAVLQLNRKRSADWGTVWEGVKKHWRLSLKWGFLVLFVYLALAANFWFYLNIEQMWALYALAITVFLSFLWIAVNQFTFPLLLLQEEKKLFLALRNGYVIVMRRPLAALKVILLTLLIAVVSTLLPPLWIFISMAVILHFRTKTVLKAVEQIREKDAQRDEKPVDETDVEKES